MKILFLLLIVSPICLHAMSSGKSGKWHSQMTSNQYMIASSDKLKGNGSIDEAIGLFSQAIKTEYGSPFGVYYSIIINGLFKLGVLSADDIVVEDYGLTDESKQKLLSIISDRKTDLRKVFATISSGYKGGIQGNITISGFNEYFDQEFEKTGIRKNAERDFYSAVHKIPISDQGEMSKTESSPPKRPKVIKHSKKEIEETKPKKRSQSRHDFSRYLKDKASKDKCKKKRIKSPE